MPKSRHRKGRRQYRAGPELEAPPRPDATADPSPRRGKEPDRAAETPEPSGEVVRLQRRIIGSEAWGRRVEDEVVLLVNTERRRRGLGALRVDEALRRSARGHSADMAARGYFAHRSPDGGTPAGRMRACGYRAPAAENIARGQPDAGAVVHAWMLSPGHRANMLRPEVRAIGVGVHHGPGGPWWTQHFGYE